MLQGLGFGGLGFRGLGCGGVRVSGFMMVQGLGFGGSGFRNSRRMRKFEGKAGISWETAKALKSHLGLAKDFTRTLNR